MVQRNIEISDETWTKLKIEAIKRNKNLREFAGEILTDFTRSKIAKEYSQPPKAIILAAGYESRLSPITDDKPTAMININGKTILQRLIENFKENGIRDISVVRGYKKERIKHPDIKYYYNRNYKKNKNLQSLFCAEAEMTDDFIVSYSDIIVNTQIIKKLLESESSITVVVDRDWLERYKHRHYHPIEEAEKASISGDRVVKIGKMINPNETCGEFIGLAKFNKHGAKLLKDSYRKAKKKSHQPFHAAPSLEKAFITDMIQELIDKKHKVSFISTKGGWLEIDTMEDLDIAKKTIR